MWCSTRFSARAPPRSSPSGSAGASSASSARKLTPRPPEPRLDAVAPLAKDALQVAKGKRAEPRIAFGVLVELGLIAPGTVLYDPAARHEAKVRADGSIACAGAEGSIHKIGAHVQGALACNGWTFWHYEADGRPRADRRAARGSPPPARITGLGALSRWAKLARRSSAWPRTFRITDGSAAPASSRGMSQRQREG